MFLEPNQFAVLMQRVTRRDQQAIAQLVHCYEPPLLHLLDGQLHCMSRLRSVVDARDVVQNIWIDFFTRCIQREQFVTPEQLDRFLTQMAYNQLLKAARDYLDARKRSLRSRRHLSDPAVAAAADAITDPSPTPATAARNKEEWERWLQSLTAEQQQVALLLRDGFTLRDIAELFECSVRTIERIVAEIRKHSFCGVGPLP